MEEVISRWQSMINAGYSEGYKEHITSISKGLSRLKCITCPECGENILMIPTLYKMVEAIENHVRLHRKQGSTCARAILVDLTQQVLQQASGMAEVAQGSPWV